MAHFFKRFQLALDSDRVEDLNPETHEWGE